MAQTPEGKVKKLVKALLGEHKVYAHWPVQAGYGTACLDCHACHQGDYFAVETKAPGKTLTPRQELAKRDIERAGGVVFVIGESVNDEGEYSGMEDLHLWLHRQTSLM